MIKLISSDMDGTLLDSYRQITPINVEAIKRAQENGINFIINTGREYPKKLSAPFLMHLINTEWNLHYLQQKDVFLFFH